MKELKIKLLLIALMSTVPALVFAHDIEVKNADGITIYYNYNDYNYGCLSVTFRGSSRDSYIDEYSGAVNIPNQVSYGGNTYSVTSIDYSTFANCSGLTSVTIPNSVTTIEGSAFEGCTNLSSITMGNRITTIGSSAFSGCSNLSSITLPEGVTSIGRTAFYECYSLNQITIPNSVTSIGDFAFEASGLERIVLPNSMKEVPFGTFAYCEKLSSVTIPNSVKTIDTWAFYYCHGLKTIELPNSITTIKKQAFEDSGLESIKLSNSNLKIEQSAFSECKNLLHADISGGSIGDYVFSGCTNLETLWIGANVYHISGNYTFLRCGNIKSIIVAEGNPTYDSRNNCNAIIDNRNYIIRGCKNTVIPESVVSIDNGAFLDCAGLASITIPNSVTSIGKSAFSGCSDLISIDIPNSVTTIGERAFSRCSGLTSITIPNSVTSIGNYAFSDSGLTSITIPNSVTTIGYGAFSDCTALTKILSLATNPPTCGTNALNDINKQNCTLTIPEGTLSKYQAADQWKDFLFIEEKDLSSINTITTDDGTKLEIKETYDLNGHKITGLKRGLNIVKMSDGTAKKIVVK